MSDLIDSDYDQFHRHRVNLLIHIFAVPLFVAGVVVAVWAALSGMLVLAGGSALLPVASLALQGAGHKKERTPPRLFTGPVNFVGRVLAEQFVRFPLFVLTGRWARAMREGK